ncbi:MAG: TRAP transporter large permease subunit, partial [Pseudomonadota bacterium]
AVIFLLGFFLDFIEIAVVVVPIVAPILLMDPGANITAVWLGVMIGLNIQSSFLTPPFGFALFYLRGVAPPSVKTTDIYKGVVPFIALQLIALGIVGSYPPLVNYLPSRISLVGENAPPPVNPLLQSCIETWVMRELDVDEAQIRAAVSEAQSLPLDALPRNIRGDLSGAFEEALAVFEHVDEIAAARIEIDAATPAYAPIHTEVRRLERDIRKDEERIEELEDRVDDLRFIENPAPGTREALEAEIARLEAEMETLAAEIPADWDDTYAAFATLLRAEQNAGRAYRRSSDEAVEPVLEFIAVLEFNDAFVALEGDLRALTAAVDGVVDEATGDALSDRIRDVRSAFSDTEAGRDLTGALRDATRPFRDDTPDLAAVRASLAEAEAAFEEERAWREAGAAEIVPGLRTYLAALDRTIGLRQKPQMPRDVALDVAACQANHRDISLYF